MRNLCVYCGSSPGRRDDYVAAARAFARELVARGLGLVYGGASVGVMGAVADAVLAEGGRVTAAVASQTSDDSAVRTIRAFDRAESITDMTEDGLSLSRSRKLMTCPCSNVSYLLR